MNLYSGVALKTERTLELGNSQSDGLDWQIAWLVVLLLNQNKTAPGLFLQTPLGKVKHLLALNVLRTFAFWSLQALE